MLQAQVYPMSAIPRSLFENLIGAERKPVVDTQKSQNFTSLRNDKSTSATAFTNEDLFDMKIFFNDFKTPASV